MKKYLLLKNLDVIKYPESLKKELIILTKPCLPKKKMWTVIFWKDIFYINDFLISKGN